MQNSGYSMLVNVEKRQKQLPEQEKLKERKNSHSAMESLRSIDVRESVDAWTFEHPSTSSDNLYAKQNLNCLSMNSLYPYLFCVPFVFFRL